MDVLDTGHPAVGVVDNLAAPLQDLVVVDHVLFAAQWDDLAGRHADRPHLFSLALALDEPLAGISRLRDDEAARGERLADAIPA